MGIKGAHAPLINESVLASKPLEGSYTSKFDPMKSLRHFSVTSASLLAGTSFRVQCSAESGGLVVGLALKVTHREPEQLVFL